MEESDERREHIDPLKVFKQNMKFLKLLSESEERFGIKVARTSSAVDRQKENEKYVSTPLHRKNWPKISRGWRSRSLFHINFMRSADHSSKQNDTHSSPSISEKLIKTHYLSNISRRPGSYLLKRSEEIIKRRKNASTIPRRRHNTHSDDEAKDDSRIGPLKQTLCSKNTQTDFEKAEEDEAKLKVEELRQSIGDILFKPKPDTVQETSNQEETSKDSEEADGKSTKKRKTLPRQQILTLPPVSQNVPYVLEARDFSLPINREDVSEDNWDEIKELRYLRIYGEEEENDDSAISSEEDDDET